MSPRNAVKNSRPGAGLGQSSAVQCSSVNCSTVQCSILQCSVVQCILVPCSTIQCSRVQCFVDLFCASSSKIRAIKYLKVHLETAQITRPIIMILLSEQCFGLKGNAEGSANITSTGPGFYMICTYMQATVIGQKSQFQTAYKSRGVAQL